MKIKRAVVLAAGKGTRMKSDLPKVLFPVCGKPMIEYVLDALIRAGIDEILVVVGFKSDLVRSALAHYPNLVFAEQTVQRGTGHAIMVCRDLLQKADGPIFVVAGDSPMIQSDTVQKLFEEFDSTAEKGSPSCLLGTICKENPFGMGRILRDEQGNFRGIVEEKDATDAQKAIREINMSYYVFDCAEMLESLDELKTDNAQNEYYITDIPRIMLEKGKNVLALPILKEIECLGVNTPADLEIVQQAMQSNG
ncbi:MAG: NTP transferase domain-containing protein [Planctomycetia bacterium]|nr:NTP transferase domain-containing protein [Planctomycetia bacterium]